MAKKKESDIMDILELYSKIQKFIELLQDKIHKDQLTLEKIKLLIENSGTYNLRSGMISKLTFEKVILTREIEEFENLKYFNYEVQPILEQYHNLNKQTMVIPFFNTDRKNLKEHLLKKNLIKKQFMDKLKEYTSLKNFEFMFTTHSIPKSSPPPCSCGNKTEFIRDEDRAVCALCSTEQSLICNASSFSDVGRVNMACKYTYNRKVHFRDCIIQYQGKQKTHIPKEIYTLLESKLLDKKLLDETTNNTKKRFVKVTRAMVLDILKELELKKFYDDIVLIHHVLTDQECDNIEYLESILLDDFDKLTDMYDRLYNTEDDIDDDDTKPTKRKNFINAQFVLYQLLKKHGHKCSEMDFLTLKTSERKRFHYTICKKLFNDLGWKYSYSI